MMKYFSLIILFILFSCGNKEDVLLPKSDTTIDSDIKDHSPIYIFFRTNGKDTLAEVNRKNSIITTNWIFNIDKRLPLRLVIPEVMKLQQKKREEKTHKNEKAQNYYSYADTIGKNLAFAPFTKVHYKLSKPEGIIVFFNKNNEIFIDGEIANDEVLNQFLRSYSHKGFDILAFRFDANMSYGMYIEKKILMADLQLNNEVKEEFIY